MSRCNFFKKAFAVDPTIGRNLKTICEDDLGEISEKEKDLMD